MKSAFSTLLTCRNAIAVCWFVGCACLFRLVTWCLRVKKSTNSLPKKQHFPGHLRGFMSSSEPQRGGPFFWGPPGALKPSGWVSWVSWPTRGSKDPSRRSITKCLASLMSGNSSAARLSGGSGVGHSFGLGKRCGLFGGTKKHSLKLEATRVFAGDFVKKKLHIVFWAVSS